MASLVAKKQGQRTYYYLVESARVGGKPRIVSQRYLGSAEEVAARLSEAGPGEPERTRHLAFGDLAAVWGVLERLGYAGIVDEAAGARRADASASVGTYLALACANRVVAPRSKLAFADWWATTAGDRLARVPWAALDHRRFWDAMDALDQAALTVIERRLAAAMAAEFGLGLSGMALDIVVLDTPSRSKKRAATCGNATPGRSLTFQVRPRIVRHDLPPVGDRKVCGGRWGSSPGEGGSAGAFGWAA